MQDNTVDKPPSPSGVTLRAVIIGLVLVVAACLWSIHNVQVLWSSGLSMEFFPVAAGSIFFALLFLNMFLKKVEENVGDATIVVHCLEKASLDAPIMAELGDRAEIQLAHFFGLLKVQSKGEEGALLVNGYANIAYIRGTDGNFWAVRAYWRSGCGDWDVRADSVVDPGGWSGGRQVLSRDS